ncbi:nucleotidyl transferase AbiEii/AbiGii toxin family protein [Candidatus Uhrbacteria bacterium]|nr:nucleotidyl transferase AbiEii/AbiGii toxin family protein [Candidatus Uhrbacteria bacterium]
MGQTILTEDQKKVLAEFSSNAQLRDVFYLAGGTALTEYYLHHRYSDDLDFFTQRKDFPQIPVEAFIQHLKKVLKYTTIEYQRLYDRRIFFLKKGKDELKIEFTQYPFIPINSLVQKNGFMVDSLPDIAAGKVMALMDRTEAKDFVDLYCINQNGGLPFEQILEYVKKKFDFSIVPLTWANECSKVRSLTVLPRMIAKLTLVELKNFFTDEARKARPLIIE